MIEAYIFVMVLAKINQYKLKLLLHEWSLYPIYICAMVYIVLQVMIFLGDTTMLKYAVYYKMITILCFIVPIIKNKLYATGILASIIMFIGLFLNSLVMKANNGLMPVYATLSKVTGYINSMSIANDGIHVFGDASTKLKILTDWIDLGYCILSPGDVMSRIFAGLIFYRVIREANVKIHEGEIKCSFIS